HDAEAVDELADLLRKGSGARERVLQATAEAGANLGEDELVGEAERHRLEQAEGLPIALLRGRAQAGIEERANGRGLFGNLLLNAVVDAIEDTRNGEENRGLHLGEIVDNLLDALGEAHRRTHREHTVQL